MLIVSVAHADEELPKLKLPLLLISMQGTTPFQVYKVKTVEEYMTCVVYIFAKTACNVIVATSLTGFSAYKADNAAEVESNDAI